MRFIIGVDEAGRGPLAGPVSVGLVTVADGFDVAKEFPGVADSKKISEKKREKLFEQLLEREKLGDVRYVVEMESAQAIDAEGIAAVIRRAITRGVLTLAPETEHVRVLLDGSLKAPQEYEQETIIGGDASVPIISLASIAAKVTRDRLMFELASKYPQYQFEHHKGYGTALHYALLKEFGPSAIHRLSYLHLV